MSSMIARQRSSAAGCAAAQPSIAPSLSVRHRRLEHLLGQRPVQAVQVVPQGGARQRLPAVGAGKVDDPVAQPVELEPRPERGSRSASPPRARAPSRSATSTMSNTEQQRRHRRDARSQLRLHAGGLAARRPGRRTPRGRRPRARPGAPSREHPRARLEVAGSCAAMSIGRGLARALASGSRARPAAGPRSASVSCMLRLDLVVERLDRRPERAHVEDLARDRVRAREQRGDAPVSSPSRKANVVPARSTSWLATTVAMISRRSRCSRICVGVALRQRRREVALEIVGEVLVLGQVGSEQPRVEGDLAVGDQHRELGRDEAPVVDLALVDLLVARAGTRSPGRGPRPARGGGSGGHGRRASARPARAARLSAWVCV